MSHVTKEVRDALEDGRKKAARVMYAVIESELGSGPGYDACNTEQRADRFIVAAQAAIAEYARTREQYKEALKKLAS